MQAGHRCRKWQKVIEWLSTFLWLMYVGGTNDLFSVSRKFPWVTTRAFVFPRSVNSVSTAQPLFPMQFCSLFTFSRWLRPQNGLRPKMGKGYKYLPVSVWSPGPKVHLLTIWLNGIHQYSHYCLLGNVRLNKGIMSLKCINTADSLIQLFQLWGSVWLSGVKPVCL